MNRNDAIRACMQWAETPIADTLVSLTKVVFDAAPGNDLGFTYASLGRALGIPKNDPRLYGSVAVATSSELHLLDPFYLFDDGTQEVEITPEDVAEAQLYGKFAHPVTGELIDGYEAFLYVSFSASEEVRHSKGGER